MKSLNKYILEKLVINKNSNLNVFYQCVKPKKEGICLEIAVPIVHNDDELGLDLASYYYNSEEDIVHVVSYTDYSYCKNLEGFYYLEQKVNYIWVLLFDEDAIKFLCALLKNPKQKMDMYDICGSVICTDTYTFQCSGGDARRNKINDMINKIK